AMFFPYFLSWVVVGAIIYAFFSTDTGMVNRALKAGGHEIIRWYSVKKYWKPIIITADVWKWCGYNSIIYMAAMTSFDASLYEAASIDGANRFKQIIHITLPLLKPTVITLSLMSIGRIFFGDFGMIYGIVGNNSLLYDEVAVIDTYVYSAMRSLGFSYTTAIGLMQSVLGLILVTGANWAAKKVNEGEALF
nr:ABC transporter permease subunit [Lachnospiraceae bacterium]